MAKLIRLTDGSGHRFSIKAAKRYGSDYEWDGRNQISKATGKRFEHETLYHTAHGRWVLRKQCDWQGVPDKWEEISEEQAMRWLRRNAPRYLKEFAK